mmetsp:Transcript_15093/g.42895  ORF Transcript_15093/g.42895 Transcript_15093/m.42895 type:complete len:217 (-) Transcript_15093:182-832(-)
MLLGGIHRRLRKQELQPLLGAAMIPRDLAIATLLACWYLNRMVGLVLGWSGIGRPLLLGRPKQRREGVPVAALARRPSTSIFNSVRIAVILLAAWYLRPRALPTTRQSSHLGNLGNIRSPDFLRSIDIAVHHPEHSHDWRDRAGSLCLHAAGGARGSAALLDVRAQRGNEGHLLLQSLVDLSHSIWTAVAATAGDRRLQFLQLPDSCIKSATEAFG